MRCIPDSGRCANCIRLKKDCTFTPTGRIANLSRSAPLSSSSTSFPPRCGPTPQATVQVKHTMPHLRRQPLSQSSSKAQNWGSTEWCSAGNSIAQYNGTSNYIADGLGAGGSRGASGSSEGELAVTTPANEPASLLEGGVLPPISLQPTYAHHLAPAPQGPMPALFPAVAAYPIVESLPPLSAMDAPMQHQQNNRLNPSRLLTKPSQTRARSSSILLSAPWAMTCQTCASQLMTSDFSSGLVFRTICCFQFEDKGRRKLKHPSHIT
jgi:hypothetical protein